MLLIFLMVSVFYISEAGRAATWDSCNCHWASWEAWSQCSVSCGGGGHRYRTRKVWNYVTPECEGFEKCATTDMGQDYDYSCNTLCYHGSYSGGSCRCHTGWYGKCCNNQVNCGHPGYISHGTVQGSSYTYNSQVTYQCDRFYSLIGGSRTRRCQVNGIWSGSKPRCAYNQPPEVRGCPDDIERRSSEEMTFLNWTAPSFFDPAGKPITVSTNYPTNSFTFPWGDFRVQYVALKPSNGLRKECTFSFKIRPYPCETLEKPRNGAKVCNGWKTDHGKFCLAFCGPEYSLDITSSHRQWYVCGARGRWIPRDSMSHCTGTFVTEKTNDDRFRFTNCSSPDQVEKMQETYLTMLQTSAYGFFCTKFQDLCRKENVIITCE